MSQLLNRSESSSSLCGVRLAAAAYDRIAVHIAEAILPSFWQLQLVRKPIKSLLIQTCVEFQGIKLVAHFRALFHALRIR